MNKVIYEEIAKKMREQGYNRDSEQCRNKVKNLKKHYREVKDNNKETGRGRKTFRYFEELDLILGHRPATVPTSLLDTGNGPVSATSSNQEADTNGK